MGQHIESLTTRLTGFVDPGVVGVKKETRQVPRRKREYYNPFGRVLDELLQERNISQTELGDRIGRISNRWSDPRLAVVKTLVEGKGITFRLVNAIVKALDLNSEERDRLVRAAEDTKGI